MGPGGLERSQNETPPRTLSMVVATTHHVALDACRPRSAHPSEPVPSWQRGVAARAGAPRHPPLSDSASSREGPAATWLPVPDPSSLLTHVSGTFLCWPVSAISCRVPVCCLPALPGDEHCFPFPAPPGARPSRNMKRLSQRESIRNPTEKARETLRSFRLLACTESSPPAHAESRRPAH
jgi:hypothetical protein